MVMYFIICNILCKTVPINKDSYLVSDYGSLITEHKSHVPLVQFVVFLFTATSNPKVFSEVQYC